MKKGNERNAEANAKIEKTRQALAALGGGAVVYRGADWFSWVTAGGSNVVLLSTDVGVAEVVITDRTAAVVTNSIEGERLNTEEIPGCFEMYAPVWHEANAAASYLKAAAIGGKIYSDRPQIGESVLPQTLIAEKRKLVASEIERYRQLGRDAAEAMTDALRQASPEWTEYELAAAGARELLARGIDPGLVMAAGERRVQIYRHPMPTHEKLGGIAMLVFCARRHGLFANLTRFVAFRELSAEQQKAFSDVAHVEAKAFQASRAGATLAWLFQVLERAYFEIGREGEISRHHQGGTTGYLSREVVASPDTTFSVEAGNALAWNPSVPGAKIEDTVLVHDQGLEILTVDARWPVSQVDGRNRPLPLLRG